MTCSVDGCPSPAWARGWCGTHYARWRRTGDPAGPSPLDPPEVKFARYVKKTDGCWLWTGPRDRKGYGRIKRYGKIIAAHRLALELAGVDLEGKYACHTCDNPQCVNPAHLYAGTHATNMRDKAERGLAPGAPGTDNPFAKLTDNDVRSIREAHAAGSTQRGLARAYGIAQSHVGRIVRREVWTHI